MSGERDRGPGGRAGAARRLAEPIRSPHLPDAVECPFCSGRETEQFAAFGSALSVSQYYCRPCRTVFEAFKWR
ncbi:MAG: hypothetical protein ACE5HF_06975 [Gemmatimonadota bacterium]